MDWFLYDNGLRYERVKYVLPFCVHQASDLNLNIFPKLQGQLSTKTKPGEIQLVECYMNYPC